MNNVKWKMVIEGFKTVTDEQLNLKITDLRPINRFTVEAEDPSFREALIVMIQKLSDHTGLIIKVEEPNNECGAV